MVKYLDSNIVHTVHHACARHNKHAGNANTRMHELVMIPAFTPVNCSIANVCRNAEVGAPGWGTDFATCFAHAVVQSANVNSQVRMYTLIEVRVADQGDNLLQAALHGIHVEPISRTVGQGCLISCAVGTCQEDRDPAKVFIVLEYLHGLPILSTLCTIRLWQLTPADMMQTFNSRVLHGESNTRHRPERQHNARSTRRKQRSPNETKPYSNPTPPHKRQTTPSESFRKCFRKCNRVVL